MRVVKRAFQRTLAALGLQIIRSSDTRVRYECFVNLAKAYEERLSDAKKPVPPNDNRPKLLARLLGTPPSEAYFIVQGLAQCGSVDGDVCEFGVAQGETSAFIANEIAPFTKKILHLFDSFEGLPSPSERDQLKDDIFSLGCMDAYRGSMSYPEAMVRARLEALPFPAQRYVIHKGFIEQLLHEDGRLPQKVSFAYVDFDLYESTQVTLEYLDHVTPHGAVIIVDDYDFFSSGPKAAVDEFVEAKRSSETVYECYVPSPCYGRFAVLTKTQRTKESCSPEP